VEGGGPAIAVGKGGVSDAEHAAPEGFPDELAQ